MYSEAYITSVVFYSLEKNKVEWLHKLGMNTEGRIIGDHLKIYLPQGEKNNIKMLTHLYR